jgi:hypothetical protein
MARATGASLKVSASQPCSGKTGTLTAKAKRNARAAQTTRSGEVSVGDQNLQRGEVEAAGYGVEPENRDEQRRGGNEGEEEELQRGLGSVLAAVHGDENRHGNQRQLPEAVVDHQVQREKDAQHGRLLNEEEREEELAPLADGVPTGDDADGSEQANQHHQPQAQAVHAHVVEDRGLLDPQSD